ncbi:MAG: acyl-CoA reductase [Candidatus Baltobacteraceae bacterium]
MSALAGLPARAIVRGIAAAAARWSDGDFPPRVRVLERIASRTGYSVPVVEYALDRLFLSVTPDALETVIGTELGSIDALDGFTGRGATRNRAMPVGSVCVISSRTTIGVALVPAIFALCAKCDVLVKDREDSFVQAFFETLADEDDRFAQAARAQAWSSRDADVPDLQAFDAVTAFGTDRTLAQIAAACTSGARFTGFGSRVSAGYLTRETLLDLPSATAAAEGAARDLILYEGEGCLSLHVLFAEDTSRPAFDRFAQLLYAAIERAAIEFPAGTLEPHRAAAVLEHHRLHAFRAANGKGNLLARPGAHALLLDPPSGDPPAFLPRTLSMHAVEHPDGALAYLRAHALPLEGFAVSSQRADVVEMVLQSGAARLAHFGELQDPPLTAHHGGQPRISGFVRWIDASR